MTRSEIDALSDGACVQMHLHRDYWTGAWRWAVLVRGSGDGEWRGTASSRLGALVRMHRASYVLLHKRLQRIGVVPCAALTGEEVTG